MAELDVDAYAFDLDGTIYLGDNTLPGAVAMIEHLDNTGVPYLFATNNSSFTALHYVERLRRMGLSTDVGKVLTSNGVAARTLRSEGVRRAYVIATPEVREEYEGTGVTHDARDPEAVLLTFDTTLDYEKINHAAQLLLAGLPYYATNPDFVCPHPGGPMPDSGSFAAMFAAATGRTPTVLGKPSGTMARAVRESLAEQASAAGRPAPARVAFVGDRLYTDIRMANEEGFVAVLVLSGEATTDDLEGSPYRPDFVAHDMLALRSASGGR